MLRPRLQRAVDAVNRSVVPVIVTFVRAREGRLWRWELRLATPWKNAAVRVALMPWRRGLPAALEEYARRRGAKVLPFQEERQRVGPRFGGVPLGSMPGRTVGEVMDELRRNVA